MAGSIQHQIDGKASGNNPAIAASDTLSRWPAWADTDLSRPGGAIRALHALPFPVRADSLVTGRQDRAMPA